MSTIQGISGAGYITIPVCPTPNGPAKTERSIDTYISGTVEQAPFSERQTAKMTHEQVEILSQKYDLRNMNRNQYSRLLAELRDSGVITAQEYSAAYAGTMPQGAAKKPVFPYGKEKTDFVQFFNSCVDYCKNVSCSADPGSAVLTSTYTRLNTIFSLINTAQQPDSNVDLDEQYSDEVVRIYEQLKVDESWTGTSGRLTDGFCVTARELAKELLLSDDGLLESMAKGLWIQRAEHNQECIKNNEPERTLHLPKSYQEIAGAIKQILTGTAPDHMDMYGDFLVPDSEIHSYMEPIDGVYSKLNSFLVHKAEKEPLSDVERLLSKDAAQVERFIWKNFDGQMKDIQDKINGQLDQSGFSLDIDKEYQFYLNSDFTFSVEGGTDEQNKMIAGALNTHPRENYKYDPLHETLMAIYFSRPDDMSFSPWRVGDISNELLQRYGITSNISNSYTKKMRQFLSAYEWHEMDRNMKYMYGFGVDDIYLDNGNIVGKTDKVTKLIEKMDADFMKETGLAYIKIKSEYTETPEFSEPVFVFKNGKFQLTYK